MKEEEKQRKFHDALLKMLYPSPPSPPPNQNDREEDEARKLGDALNCPLVEEELENEESHSSPSSGEAEKLTRAQRKRRRKKKLREAAAARRRKIIGPQLPGSSGDGGSDVDIDVQNNEPESVRQNAAEGADAAADISETTCCGSNQNKVKQRRKSKKLAGKVKGS